MVSVPFPKNPILKVLVVIFGIGLGFVFLPFAIGGSLSYIAYKKLSPGTFRNAIIGILVITTLFIGSAWTGGVFSPSPTKQSSSETKKEVKQEVTTGVQEDIKSASVAAERSTAFYSVSKVVDGDTLSVSINSKQEVVRLIGIDSPESVDPRKPVQCFGKEAAQKAQAVLTGKKVSLESDPTQGDKDKYNRLLRYVYLEDGTSFNKLMVAEGYAHEYTYNIPYKYQSEYKETEKQARDNKKGLWADNACQTSNMTNTVTPAPSSPAVAPESGGTFTCAGKTTCGQMTSCAEAYFYLNNCGVSRLDGDKDGVPCETLCR